MTKALPILLLIIACNFAVAGEATGNKTIIHDGKNERLEILNTERVGQAAELLDAQNTLLTAQDKVAAQKDVDRIMNNIKMISAEIEVAQKQVPTFIKAQNQVAKVDTKKVVATPKAVDVTQDVNQAAIDQEVNYEPWDVFKNFKTK